MEIHLKIIWRFELVSESNIDTGKVGSYDATDLRAKLVSFFHGLPE